MGSSDDGVAGLCARGGIAVAAVADGDVAGFAGAGLLALLWCEGRGEVRVDRETGRAGHDTANVGEARGCEAGLCRSGGGHETGDEGEARHVDGKRLRSRIRATRVREADVPASTQAKGGGSQGRKLAKRSDIEKRAKLCQTSSTMDTCDYEG